MSTLKTNIIEPNSNGNALIFSVNNSNRVVIGTDGVVSITTGFTSGITIDGGPVNATRGISVGGASSFSDGVTFSSFYVTSGATFASSIRISGATSSAVISCSTAPSQGQHLTNKTYVEDYSRIGAVVSWGTYGGTPPGWTITESAKNVGGGYIDITPPGTGTWAGWVQYRASNSSSYNQGFEISGGVTTRIPVSTNFLGGQFQEAGIVMYRKS